MIDLHSHTTASDGKHSPKEVIDLAIEKDLEALAITDHDTVGGLDEAIHYADGKPIRFIPGIEIGAAVDELDMTQVDVVGLFIDHNNEAVKAFSDATYKAREDQKRDIVKKLQDLNYDITYEEVREIAQGSIGRPHVAQILMNKYPDEFDVMQDVFDQLLNEGKPAFVKLENRISMEDTVDMIHQAGGTAILAHPGLYGKDKATELINYFKGIGGDGVETMYPYHVVYPKKIKDEAENDELNAYFKSMAQDLNLVESGGSDFHNHKRSVLGDANVENEVLDDILEYRGHN